MLNHDRLAELYRDARDLDVLSIYVDGDQHDPAERHVWRTRVDSALAERRREIESDRPGELEAFDAARERLEGELRSFSNFMPERGWVGFATEDRVLHAGTVPVPMPDLVVWERGLHVAPCVRALKQERPVVVALADRHHARLFVYREGEVREEEEFTAEDDRVEISDAQSSRRSGERSGTRGNATDEAQRQVEIRADAMLDRVVSAIGDRAGSDGLVVVGGTRETGKRLLQRLPAPLGDRALEVASLHLELSLDEVRRQAEASASSITRRLQAGLVDEVIDRAHSGGRGVLGDEDTADALLKARVDTLLVSRSFRDAHSSRANHMVGTAFEHGATVEEISGEGSDRLSEEGDGVGALLRW